MQKDRGFPKEVRKFQVIYLSQFTLKGQAVWRDMDR